MSEFNIEFLGDLQRNIAWRAVGPTTLRKMVPAGGRKVVCEYLAKIQLCGISKEKLSDMLNEWTGELQEKLSELNNDRARYWGPSRKSINLFLRDISYNYVTRKEYGFEAFDECLEVPLDGLVMAGIRRDGSAANLNRCAVIGLNPEWSLEYQDAAKSIAEAKEMNRVDLDILWFNPPPHQE